MTEFRAGSVPAGLTVANEAGGEVRFSASLEDYFDGTSLSTSRWTWGSWDGSSYTPAPSGGLLPVQSSTGSAWVRSVASYTQQTLEGRVRFEAGPWEHFGWADEGFANCFAILSTAKDAAGVYARTYAGGQEVRTLLSGVSLNAYHDVRIAWGTSGVDYYVGGALLASHARVPNCASYVYASNNATAGTLSVEWARVASYSPGNLTYESSVKDAGSTVTWGQLSWIAQLPTGTSLAFYTRSSTDGVAWSAWAGPLTTSGGAITSPTGRYLQYRATMGTTSTPASPRLDEVGLTMSRPTPTPTWTPAPTVTATSTVLPSATPTAGSVSTGTEVTVSVMTSEDDARSPDSGTYSASETIVPVGAGNGAAPNVVGFRFADVPIPQGVTVDSATFSLVKASDEWRHMVAWLAFEDVDSASPFSVSAPPATRSRTPTQVLVDQNVPMGGGVRDTIGDPALLGQSLQEVLSRPNWQWGNSVALIAYGPPSPAWARLSFLTADAGPEAAPRLVVRYRSTGPASDATATPAATGTAGVTASATASMTATVITTATATAPATATPTATPPLTPSPTPDEVVREVFFPVGAGFTDVIPHQVVRARDDRLYLFVAQAQQSPTLRAYWTTAAGLPRSGADFGGSAQLTEQANILSVEAAYDGDRTIHILVNTQAGELVHHPYDIATATFGPSRVLVAGNPTVSGDYIGTSGVSAMVDRAGVLHVTYWAAGDQIIHWAYSFAATTGTLTLVGGPTRVDIAGSATHPAVAVSPADDSLTVAWVSEATVPARILTRRWTRDGGWDAVETASTAPAWTSRSAGVAIDQGPSLLVGPDGTQHLVYIEDWDSSGDYGRVHHVTNTGTGWIDQALPVYSHDPALAIAGTSGTGELRLLGHGHPLNATCRSMDVICIKRREADGSWGPSQVFASPVGGDSFDASASVKWSVVGFNRPEVVEFLFFATNGGSYNDTTIYYGRFGG